MRPRRRATLLIARDSLVKAYKAAEAAIRGLLKRFGVRLGQVSDTRFAARVREELARLPEEVKLGLEPLLELAGSARQKAEALKRQITARAAKDAAMRRLMSVPGVDRSPPMPMPRPSTIPRASKRPASSAAIWV